MKRLLIVSSVRWNFLWQRHHSLATAAAGAGWSVDFYEPPLRGIRQVAGVLKARAGGARPSEIANPVHSAIRLVQPPKLLAVSPRAQRLTHLRGALKAHYDACILYLPDPLLVDFAAHVAIRVIYDEVVDWSSAPASWYPPRGYAAAEQAMREPTWLHMTDSAEVARRNHQRGLACLTLPPAADEPFLDRSWSEPVPGAPILYFGTVRQDETDVDLLCALAEAGQHVRLIGPIVETRAARRLAAAGTDWRGSLPAAELPSAIDACSVLILPYASARHATLVPAKLWNCLATNRTILFRGLRPPDGVRAHLTELPEAMPQAVEFASKLAAYPASRVPLEESWSDRWETVERELLF
jgi:hypothetical protein